MKSNVNWFVIFSFIIGFLFFILSVFNEDIHIRVMELFVSGFYFLYAFSIAIHCKIEQSKKEIIDELKKLK